MQRVEITGYGPGQCTQRRLRLGEEEARSGRGKGSTNASRKSACGSGVGHEQSLG
jgi:hypothetical protein